MEIGNYYKTNSQPHHHHHWKGLNIGQQPILGPAFQLKGESFVGFRTQLLESEKSGLKSQVWLQLAV